MYFKNLTLKFRKERIKIKILIVEDDKNTVKLIKKALENKEINFFETNNPINAFEILKKEKVDVIILDIMLPEMDGFMVCKIIRKYPESYGNPFIIMLTSKTEDEDVIKGLRDGADDYIKKPFNHKELFERINAVYRRLKRIAGDKIIYEDLIIDLEKEIILDTNKNSEINLSDIEYKMILFFVQNKGITLKREKIYEYIWGGEQETGDRIVDIYVLKIRKKIKTIEKNLNSIRGRGYKLNSAAN